MDSDNHIYKQVWLTGSSPNGIEDAINPDGDPNFTFVASKDAVPKRQRAR